MTVTFLEEIADARQASNRLGIRTYTTAYRLETDSQDDTAYDVGSHGSLPVIGSTFADDAQAYCNNIQITNSAPWKGWTATYEYSTDRQISSTDPEDDEVKVSWTSEVYNEPVFQDVSGNAIVNSAGDYFIDPVPSRDAVHLIAKIRANVRSVPSWVLAKQNNVNNNVITIGGLDIAAGLARMSRLEISERQRRNDIDFYGLSFEVHIHSDGWRVQPMDVGFRELEYGELIQIKDTNGDEVTTPVMLDGEGAAQNNPTPSSAVFGDFEVYAESDLTTLPGIS